MSDDTDLKEWYGSTEVVLAQDIIGHPEQLPTFAELDYFNPSTTSETLRAQLGTMVDKGMVEPLEHNGERFYGLTEDYRDTLEEANLMVAEETNQEATLMTQLTDEIEAKMELDRPEWGPAKAYGGRTMDGDDLDDALSWINDE